MSDATFVLAFLSLFTSVERAAEIEGDLLEQAGTQRRLWFVGQVLVTGFVLFLHGIRQQPGKLLLFSYAVYELTVNFNWWVLTPLRRTLGRTLDLSVSEMLMTNDLINGLVGFSLGMLLTRLFPKYAGQIILLTSTLWLGRIALLTNVQAAVELAFFALTPALLGALCLQRILLQRRSGQQSARV